MGLLKLLCKAFRCKSNCEIDGNALCDGYDMTQYNLNDYKLKIKDIDRIVKILAKREPKENSDVIAKTEIKYKQKSVFI